MPHPVWYEQAELDLAALVEKVPLQKLASCYRSMLRDRTALIDTIYEIHGAAFLARIGQAVDLHVPRRQGDKLFAPGRTLWMRQRYADGEAAQIAAKLRIALGGD